MVGVDAYLITLSLVTTEPNVEFILSGAELVTEFNQQGVAVFDTNSLLLSIPALRVDDVTYRVELLLVTADVYPVCLLYTSPSPRDVEESRMPSSA